MLGGGEGMLRYAHWFKTNAGFNTLDVTRRGYTGSEGSTIASGELGIYYDVQASISYLVRTQNIPLHQIWFYGYCLGGSYAMTAGSHFTGLGGIILDRAFPSYFGSAHRPFRFIPKFAMKRIYNQVFPEGIIDPLGRGVDFVEPDVDFSSSGMSLINMLKEYSGPQVFFMFGSDDWIIPHYQTLELLQAYTSSWYPDQDFKDWPLDKFKQLQNVAVLQKGHLDFFMKGEDMSRNKLLRFINLVSCINEGEDSETCSLD
jgi:hypothetical protein